MSSNRAGVAFEIEADPPARRPPPRYELVKIIYCCNNIDIIYYVTYSLAKTGLELVPPQLLLWVVQEITQELQENFKLVIE